MKETLIVLAIGIFAGLLPASMPDKRTTESYGIPIDQLEEQYCEIVTVDWNDITFVGLQGPFTKRHVGNQLALSTGPDNTIRIIFPYWVKAVRAYMASDPGEEDNPPIAVCYGEVYYTDVEESVVYAFGPGLTRASFPSTAQYSGGTPGGDEFRFSVCDLQHGTFWRLVYEEAEEE